MATVGQVDVEKMGLGLEAAHGGYSLIYGGMWEEGTRPAASQGIPLTRGNNQFEQTRASLARQRAYMTGKQRKKGSLL